MDKDRKPWGGDIVVLFWLFGILVVAGLGSIHYELKEKNENDERIQSSLNMDWI